MPSTLQDVRRIPRRYPARTVLHPTRRPTAFSTGSRDRTARRFHPGLFVHSHGSRRSLLTPKVRISMPSRVRRCDRLRRAALLCRDCESLRARSSSPADIGLAELPLKYPRPRLALLEVGEDCVSEIAQELHVSPAQFWPPFVCQTAEHV